MKDNSWIGLSILVSWLGIAIPAHATIISVDTTNLSGNTWEFSYSVTNDTLPVAIEEFTIFFDAGLYRNIVTGLVPADWDPLIVQPDTLVPLDGAYDALALGAGAAIATGETVAGFAVRFDYLGLGVPGLQAFDIIDPNTFLVLGSGTTILVPSPPVILLIWGILPAFLRVVNIEKI
ncbi:MAG: hypothetical protein GC138_01255 [Gammaproteobacteria bacterium]|nr:hypothetical protein [Gammaproteobacteria bacterium]